jgi:hypothetical protein
MALKMAAVEPSETTHHGVTYQKSNFNIHCLQNPKYYTFTDTILVITNDRAYVKLRLGSLQFTDSS